jgi:hypothetical protein
MSTYVFAIFMCLYIISFLYTYVRLSIYVPTSRVYTFVCAVSSQSHIATEGLSWCRAPAGAHDQVFLLV